MTNEIIVLAAFGITCAFAALGWYMAAGAAAKLRNERAAHQRALLDLNVALMAAKTEIMCADMERAGDEFAALLEHFGGKPPLCPHGKPKR